VGQRLLDLIREISTRMRQYRELTDTEDLTGREAKILEIIGQQGPMNVSNIVSEYNRRGLCKLAPSTISTSISRLYRDTKCVSKVIDPSNQRVTTVDLTKKGRQALERLEKAKSEQLKTLAGCFKLTREQEDLVEKVFSEIIVALDQRLQSESERRGISEE